MAREVVANVLPLHLYAGSGRRYTSLRHAITDAIRRAATIEDGMVTARRLDRTGGVWEAAMAALKDQRQGETYKQLGERFGVKPGTLQKYKRLAIERGLKVNPEQR